MPDQSVIDIFETNQDLDDLLENAAKELNFLRHAGVDEPEQIEPALSLLQRASEKNQIEINDDFSHRRYEALISYFTANTYLAADELENATQASMKALEFFDEFPQHLTYESPRLYGGFSEANLGQALKLYETDPQRAEIYFEDAVKYDDLFVAATEGPLDKNAIRIAQSEVGFSSRAPIGTDNIIECVVIAVRDCNDRVALAHVDFSTSPESLNKILDHMDLSSPLEAKIIGGRIDGQKGSRNIEVAENFVHENDIKVLSRQIDDHPSAIVIDPKTFEVRESVPWAFDPSNKIQNGLASSMNSEGERKSIRLGYDDEIGRALEPIAMNSQQAQNINNDIIGKSPLQAYLHLEKSGELPDNLSQFSQFYSVHEAYSKASAPETGLPYDENRIHVIYKPEQTAPPDFEAGVQIPTGDTKNLNDTPHIEVEAPQLSKMALGASASGAAMGLVGFADAAARDDEVGMVVSGADVAVSSADTILEGASAAGRTISPALRGLATKANVVVLAADGAWQISQEEGLENKTARGAAVATTTGTGLAVGSAASGIALTSTAATAAAVTAPIVATVAVAMTADSAVESYKADGAFQDALERTGEVYIIEGERTEETGAPSIHDYRNLSFFALEHARNQGVENAHEHVKNTEYSDPQNLLTLEGALNERVGALEGVIEENDGILPDWLRLASDDEVSLKQEAQIELASLEAAQTELGLYREELTGLEISSDNLRSLLQEFSEEQISGFSPETKSLWEFRNHEELFEDQLQQLCEINLDAIAIDIPVLQQQTEIQIANNPKSEVDHSSTYTGPSLG